MGQPTSGADTTCLGAHGSACLSLGAPGFGVAAPAAPCWTLRIAASGFSTPGLLLRSWIRHSQLKRVEVIDSDEVRCNDLVLLDYLEA